MEGGGGRGRRAMPGGPRLGRAEAKDALLSSFHTIFDLIDHITSMRASMERMELYLLIMVLIIGTLTLVGLVGGIGYVCSLLHASRGGERTVVVSSSRAGSFQEPLHSSARPSRATLIKRMPSDAKL